MDCGPPPQIENAYRESVESMVYMSTVNYQCLAGYWFMPGAFSDTVRCGSDGDWLVSKYLCSGKTLLIPKIFTDVHHTY